MERKREIKNIFWCRHEGSSEKTFLNISNWGEPFNQELAEKLHARIINLVKEFEKR